MKKIKVDKVASTTINLDIPNEMKEVEISEEIIPESGTVVAVKALEEKMVYNQLELRSGRLSKISRDDVIVGVLGRRSALKGFVGIVPESIKAGQTLNILNIGGIIGKAISYNREYGKPLNVEVLGMVVKDGRSLNIKNRSLSLRDNFDSSTPIILVSGTNMNCGKTIVVSKIIRGLTLNGYRVGGGKVTGIGALKDTLNMVDHGAVKALSFLDFGFPSTVNIDRVEKIGYSIIKELDKEKSDVIVLELGDGIYGEYGVENFFNDTKMRENVIINIACANDQVGARGIVEFMLSRDLKVDIISGPVTDNIVGINYIKNRLKISAINSIDNSEKITEYIINKIR
ncbi:MAG: hypothetical protein DRP84_11465 [Spirochaetes bacterium]|nr:MAG: hypothetical protein DRP84_11465 [Spirochaetota bacterium]